MLAVFIAKSVDIHQNRVVAEAMFPVRVVLEPLTPDTPSKGEVYSDCKIVKVPVDDKEQSPYELRCKDKRKFRVKSISFTEPAK